MKLITFFKHVFIPHEGNNYKPHFFRELSVAILLFSSIFLLGFSAGSSYLIHKTVLGASVAASVLIDLANDSRLAFNEAPLIRNDKLERAAQLKGANMAEEGYFAHDSPEGITPWHWFKEAGYTFLYAGENLAINFTESQAVQDAWMASPLHRANLLDVKFREIGIATVDGVYKGNPTTFVVQMFGTPAHAETAKEEQTSPVVTSTEIGQPTPTIEASTELAVAGEVKGDVATTTNTITNDAPLLAITSTPELAIVKNTEAQELTPLHAPTPVTYSLWWERLLFSGSRYVDTLYKVLIIFVAVALVTMILIEIRKQHPKHILYGVLLLSVFAVLIYINKGFIY